MSQADRRASMETPLWFRGDGEVLFGLLTAPEEAPRGIGVILLNGGACTPATGRNRFSVRLARRLAAAGFHALRFDYHGVGESTGEVRRYSLNRPFTQDLLGAVDLLRGRGLDRVLLIGRCFGARTALSAVGRAPEVSGMAFISMPLHDFATLEADGGHLVRPELGLQTLAGLLGPRRRFYLRVGYYAIKKAARRAVAARGNGEGDEGGDGDSLDWVSDAVVRWLSEAVAREIPLLFLYGAGETHYREFVQAGRGAVGRALAQAGPRAAVWTIEGAVHDLTTLWVQEAIIERLLTWAQEFDFTGAGAARRSPAPQTGLEEDRHGQA